MKNKSRIAKLSVWTTSTLMVLLSASGASHARPQGDASSDDAIFATRDAARGLAKKGDLARALSECKKLATPHAAICAAEVHGKPRRAAQADDELSHVNLPESATARVRAWHRLVEGKTRGLALENEQANLLFREASVLAPTWCEPYAAKGDISTGETAVTAYRRAAELCPADRDIAMSLARALPAGEERLGIVRTLREKQGKKSPDGRTLSMIAESAFLSGAFEEAEGAAKICLTIRPGDRASTLVLAESALRSNNGAEAEPLARGLAKRNPSDRAAHFVLAKALAAQNKLDPAAESFRNAFALDSRDVAPLVLAAKMWLDHGRLTTARSYAKKATVEVPSSKEAWTVLGMILRAENQRDAANEAFAKAK